jgi:hypothetical protein
MASRRPALLFWIGLGSLLFLSRFAHRNILWADEDYHLAGAIQLLWGKFPYRDFWYDKPPLNLAWFLLFGAKAGVLLRVAGTLLDVGCCWLMYRLAERLWGRAEGIVAAGLLAFFLTFYLAPGVIPQEPDSLMLAPHVGAVYLAARKRPLAAGVVSGLAFLLSTKGVLVLAAGVLFDISGVLWMTAGFLVPCVAAAGILAMGGALSAYWEQVWRWGFLYAGAEPMAQRSIVTLLNWLGFQSALVIGCAWWWLKSTTERHWQLLGWIAISLMGVAMGWRFFPRYFLQLLPALAIPAARGLVLLRRERPILAFTLVGAALAVPLIRFGPRYVDLTREDMAGVAHLWQDVSMDRESKDAARVLSGMAEPGDTIFIWGYRPDLIAYTRLPVGARLWDSQPVTGVPADRHLSSSQVVAPEWAARNRAELARSRPVWIADGLSAYNAALDIHRYADLAGWLSQYCEARRIGQITLYRLCSKPDGLAK